LNDPHDGRYGKIRGGGLNRNELRQQAEDAFGCRGFLRNAVVAIKEPGMREAITSEIPQNRHKVSVIMDGRQCGRRANVSSAWWD